MDKGLLLPGDEYDKKCGDIFLTKNGNILFHCTLCENKFSGFYNYFDHVYKRHYAASSEKRKTTEQLHEMMGFGTKNKSTESTSPVKAELLTETITENNTGLVNESQFDNENTAALLDDIAELAESSEEDFDDSSDEDYADEETHVKKPKKAPKRKRVYKPGDELLQCPRCEYKTKHKKHMKDHVERHEESNKIFKCTDCDKAFFKKYELISHTRTHTGERPYLCPDCGRGFAKSSSLLEHVKRHRNIRDKECEVCNMKFYNAKELRIHKAVHSDARPFACSYCTKAFKTRLSLKTHTKIHENKQEYECNFCHATFNQSSGLYSHINNKH